MKFIQLTTIILCLFVAFIGVPVAAAQQNCNTSMRQSTPDGVFSRYDDGTATHQTTGLMWMRCSLGQSWDGKGCAGAAAPLNWVEALAASAAETFAGYRDWRLPNKNELDALVEQACFAPAINERVFPATPSLFFWTSSPYAGLAQGAWSVDFGFGVVIATVKTGKLPVRLVRDIVW